MWLFWILLILALFWGLMAAVRGSGGNGASDGPRSALEILKERYARGEIDREEFESKKKDLIG